MVNLAEYGKEIVSLIVPFVTWFLNVGVKARAKLIWTTQHAFTFLVQEPLRDAEGKVVRPSQSVYTASVRVINSGREVAHQVELVFNYPPQYINLWPVRSYDVRSDKDNRHMLIFENLAPKEEIGIEIMSINYDLPALIQVRCAECIARKVDLMWFVKVPPWRFGVARFLVFVGFATTVYCLITLIQFLVLKTPLGP